MNRQTILANIHRHLRESFAETGEERPLGEIVSTVASEMRSGSDTLAVSPARVIPIEKVAAFVDGDLESADADLICEAVIVDNSVLAEVVAAIRAGQFSNDQLPPLPESLSGRLLAMNPMTLESSDAGDGSDDNALVSEIMVQRAPKLTPVKSSAERRKRVQIAAGLIAVAATIATAIVLLGRRGNETFDQTIVVDNDSAHPERRSVLNEVPDVVRLGDGESSQGSVQSVVGNDSPVSRSNSDASPGDIPDSNPAVATILPKSEVIAPDSLRARMPIESPELRERLDPDSLRPLSAAPRLADFRWTEVSGLFAQRNDSPEQSRSRRVPTWSRILQGAPSSANSSSNTNSLGADKIALRTLPFSRANGELVTGGRIVIAGDTGLQITRGNTDCSAEVDLMYGSVAMVGLAEGTIIKLQHGDRTFATLRWQSKATAVVHRQSAGLQIHVDGGQIAVNDQTVKGESVRVANDQAIETVRAPKRLPRWITRPDESTAAERMILAQLADTDDLAAALNQKINALALSPRLSRAETLAMAKLANWQAAMSESNLLRLAGSRVPTVRLAALQRLAMLPESDPRFQRVWNAIERSSKNPRRSAQIRGWFRLLRNGSRPSAIQLEQMLTGLSSRDFAVRGMSDFILRQFVRNPPHFDPSWTGQTQQRAVNVYRERAGLRVDRIRAGGAAGLP